ncbi:MAG: glycosyltransferase family 2 protein, partial [Gordonia sp. (in: high G+C Gram-positive bacteria)]
MVTVGVVIPMYRCADYVRGCLESVLAQTRPVDQIVLVDDRGEDETVDVAVDFLTERGTPFDLVVQPENGGLGRARNTGLAALDTDLVCFLDSDDQVEPTFVEALLSALEAADADFAVCRTSRVDLDGRQLQVDEDPVAEPVLTGPDYARELLRGSAKGYACTKLFRRELLGDRPWAEDQAYEDMAPCVRLALVADRVALVDEPLYRYLYRPGSLSTALSESTFDLFI